MFIKWLREGLRQQGKTQRGLADALGVAPSAVSRLLSGERALLADEISKAAFYLNMPPPLVGNHDIEPVQTVPVRYTVARGVWRESGLMTIHGLTQIPIAYDARYAGMEQWAARLDASQTYVICVPYEKSRPVPRPDDLVLIERTKNDLSEFLLCTTVYHRDGVWRLRTVDPPHVEFPMSHHDLIIVGLCIGRYQAL